ncbi:SH3 domain-containing protein [Conexibacter woesei]|uniref:SH3 domain-containing protein n=1 Tax=Conexibacter woesei TaxID=191495 RepID=UPI0003F6550E|nr:SH3 domain-containing protein [Conexibacter woesei]
MLGLRSRRGALAAVAVSAALCASPAVAAASPRSAVVCVAAVGMYETPGGARVGVLHRGDRVRVVTVGADDPWWRVAAAFGTRGWVRESALCDGGGRHGR